MLGEIWAPGTVSLPRTKASNISRRVVMRRSLLIHGEGPHPCSSSTILWRTGKMEKLELAVL